MVEFLTIYYYTSLVVGLTNLRYDGGTQIVELYHWPTIVYSAVLNLVFIMLQPISMLHSSRVSLNCDEFGALVVIKLLSGIAYFLAYLSIMCMSWLKRKKIHQLYYKYLALTRRYFTETILLDNYEAVQRAQRIFLKKFCSSVCKAIVVYVNIHHYYTESPCEYVKSLPYVAISLYYGLLNVQQLIVDVNVILGLLLIDLCLSMLSHTLEEIERDIWLMAKARKVQENIFRENQQMLHRKWRGNLNRTVEGIAAEVMHLQSLTHEHLDIYEIPVLFLLLAVFISLITMMFNIMAYVADFGNVQPLKLSFYVFILLANISNVMIFYNICESLQRTYARMVNQVYRIGIYASLGGGGYVERDSLVLSLEMLLMQLRYREFRVTVCGLFEIRNRTGMIMIHKIVLNLMYLIQSVVQSIA
ncbi:putative gustatory receptor 58c [Musca domestica]|uniref:Gustatory receptor n=1 Tax=Musca domestica TaxID=7370 RepID=A0A9J7DC32_MUSDO|nr:putative gustatory receptor 58c [Musca domestica]